MNPFFNYEGRLNRQPYFFRVLGLSVVTLIAIYLPQVLHLQPSVILNVVILAISLVVAVLIVLQHIARLHDMNRSGWFAALQFVPFINLLFGIYLIFAKGTPGPNRFGEDPLATA